MSTHIHNIYPQTYIEAVHQTLMALDVTMIDAVVQRLWRMRIAGGRLFVLGVGGSAANASHAVNDFRKIAGIEAYTPTDNVAELTARANDDGWESTFDGWLRVSRLTEDDVVMVLSVGGGSENVSQNIVAALKYAEDMGVGIVGIVGRGGGYTAQAADACVVVKVDDVELITPLVESVQVVLLHLIVTHPKLRR